MEIVMQAGGKARKTLVVGVDEAAGELPRLMPSSHP